MWNQECWAGWGHGLGMGGMIMMLLFWALIIAGVVMLLGRLRKREFPGHGETALEILKKRYALGEIGKDEFARMKKDLES